jgi:hypothetical protein
MKRHIAMMVAVVGLTLAAESVAAQAASTSLAAAETNKRAEQLRRSAQALYEQPTQLRRAAELHEQEAATRKDTDPQRVDALDLAARLYAYSGDPERGHELMARAARQALKCGDVRRSAHAFIDAAFIALRARDVKLADELTREAELLALSPLLSSAEKVAIVKRIDPARVQLGALSH